jgi:hypothetical protein
MTPFFEIGQIVTAAYSIFFLIVFPFFGFFETIIYEIYAFEGSEDSSKLSSRIFFSVDANLNINNII